MAQIDLAAFRVAEAAGLLTCRPHPTLDLVIWNYTPRCQFEGTWNEVTMQARGLVTQLDGTIVARPFHKFFGPEQTEQYVGPLPDEPFEVTEKVDGSLGICFYHQDQWIVATRGSFISEQALHAQTLFDQYIKQRNGMPSPEYTYLYEIVYKANRIVVDYGDIDELVLLAIIHTETGMERHEREYRDSPFRVAKRYSSIRNAAELARLITEHDGQNEEGFVVRYRSGLRVKYKLAEYTRLHYLLTGITSRTIWEYLSTNQPLSLLLEHVPDEFYRWVTKTVERLQEQCRAIKSVAQSIYDHLDQSLGRKEIAALVVQGQYPHIVFALLDHKPYQHMIWKMIKPQAEKPFREDEEG